MLFVWLKFGTIPTHGNSIRVNLKFGAESNLIKPRALSCHTVDMIPCRRSWIFSLYFPSSSLLGHSTTIKSEDGYRIRLARDLYPSLEICSISQENPPGSCIPRS